VSDVDTKLALEVVRSTPDAIILADVDGLVRLWNAGAERMFGYSADEVLGQSLDLIIPERLRHRHWDAYHAAMAAGQTKYGADELLAVPAQRKDGTRISIEFTIALLRDDDGAVIGPAAVIRDVTARWHEQTELRRRLAEAEAQLASRAGPMGAPA
jgi:PAS domain S-box-containing protein